MIRKLDKRLKHTIIFLILFYIFISIICVIDVILLIKQCINNTENKTLSIIFLVLYPISLLIQAFFLFYEFEGDSNYNFQNINNRIEITNSKQIFELDFRYFNEDDINKGIIIVLGSTILSYTKLIIIHLAFNSYKHRTKLGFLSSLKFVLLKIAVLQYIFQSLPSFIIYLVSALRESQESQVSGNNKAVEIVKILITSLYNVNFSCYTVVLIFYLFFYKFYFSKIERDLIYNSSVQELTDNTDKDNVSVNTIDLKQSNDFDKKKIYPYSYKTQYVKSRLNTSECMEFRNSL